MSPRRVVFLHTFGDETRMHNQGTCIKKKAAFEDEFQGSNQTGVEE
jgi:hypothetical protein